MTIKGALFALITLGVATGGCASYSTHVDTEDAALGRVVVYRNGIAYYERHAQVIDGRLTMTVPHDKVDDFLKSLTVADALTGKPLPVSFPTSGANSDNRVDMVVQVPDASGPTNVVLTYITEAPAWKPSYRVMVSDDEVRLQGWAVVDNTSGESWEKVRVGVGSSSALSFRYDLRTVRNVFRETLRTRDHFAVAPPTGGATLGATAPNEQVVAVLSSVDIPADPAPAQDAYDLLGDDDAEAESLEKTAVDARRAAKQREVLALQQVKQLAEKLKTNTATVTIEGYAASGERDAVLVSGDRANWLRNELINEGIAPARLKIDARGVVKGQNAGVKLVQTSKTIDASTVGDGPPVGESHFESDRPVTVDKGTSAMIAILDDGATGDIVYLYDQESARGNDRYAFKAIRFKNPTDYTLETGPMTVYGAGRFIGEGLADPIPPKATALVPFALDRQVVVERDAGTGDRISRLISLQRGILRTEVEHTRTTRLKMTSMLHKPTQVFVRHTVRKGWNLTSNPSLYEKLGEAHLFKVELAPGESRTIEIVESTPLQRTINVRSPQGIELVRVYLEGKGIDERFAEPMRKLLALHTDMANFRQQIVTTRERMLEFRTRMGEIQSQIESLAGVRGGGSLLRHLQSKLKDMSNRVQKATIEVVNLQERLMLSRIRFQDGVAELRMDQRVSAARPTG